MAKNSPCAVVYSFYGTVQGVGFRYTAKKIARQFSLMGYVKNCSDGSVELLLEGSAARIESYIAELAKAMAANIQHTAWRSAPPQGLRSFAIIR